MHRSTTAELIHCVCSAVTMAENLEMAIAVRGVVKGYGSHLVLKGLNMDVPCGSM